MPQRLRAWHGSGLGFSPFAHHYLGYLLRFLFLGVLRCFTSPGSLHALQHDDIVAYVGFPHSDIRGLAPLIGLPRLFADWHVLLRLPAPWHPPCALSYLTVQPRKPRSRIFLSLSSKFSYLISSDFSCRKDFGLASLVRNLSL